MPAPSALRVRAAASASATGTAAARAALERAFNPPVYKAPTPPPSARNVLRGTGLFLLGAVAPLLRSDGELVVAKLQGRIAEYVSLRDLQDAERAFGTWNAPWRAPASWSADQVGRSIEGAAALLKLLTARRISSRQFGQAMHALVQRVDGLTRQAKAPPPGQPAAQPAARPAPRPAAAPGAASGPASRPRIDPAVAAARTRFKAVQTQARELDQQVVAQQRTAAAGWDAAQKSLARFDWQAAGGRAAQLALRGVLAEVEARLQALRTVYRQANAPVAALKVARQRLEQIASGDGGHGLAPQAAQARSQVARWAQAADAWRSRLSEQINTLAQWKQAAQRYGRALAEPGLAPYRLSDRQAHVTHTGGVGTAEEIATRQREATARALWEAAAIYYDRRKTLLAGGSEAALAEAVYKDTPLHTLGVSLAQFQAHLQAGQEPAGVTGTRVSASGSGRDAASGAGDVSRHERPQQQPNDDGRERAIILGLNTLAVEAIRTLMSPETPEGRDRLEELQDTRSGWEWTQHTRMSLPGGVDGLPPMPVTIQFRHKYGRLQVSARLSPARSVDALTRTHGYFVSLDIPATAFIVNGAVTLGQERIDRPGDRHAAGSRPIDPQDMGGVVGVAGHFGLPTNFFDETLSAETFAEQLARTGFRFHPSWLPSLEQQLQLVKLFGHRKTLEALLRRRYSSHEEALLDLVDKLRAMERQTPGMFPVELLFHVFPATLDGSEWGIGFGALGQDRSVDLFPVDREQGLGDRDSGPGITSLHVHPTDPGPVFLGNSLSDVLAVLRTGNAFAVYDNGAGLRIRLDDSWFERTSEERRAITNKLDGLIRQFDELHQRIERAHQDWKIERAHQDWKDGAYAKTELPLLQWQLSGLVHEARQQLGELPIAFETIGGNPHPERTAAVVIRRDLPLLLLPQVRKR